MKGMMLAPAWIQNIIGGISDAIEFLFGLAIQWLLNQIVIPILCVVFMICQYIIGGLFYSVSAFLLCLIDLLEGLFRSLAGLAPMGDKYISFSIGGKSGDLLIQLLTSKEILLAFEATAIAGIFLLIIMTIFQMIKVEYTTEGAENNKTKILGKSL